MFPTIRKYSSWLALALVVSGLVLFLTGCTLILPVNQPPNPSFDYSPKVPVTGERVQFDAGSSTDPASAKAQYIQNYRWKFEDETKSGVRVTKTFYTAGMHTVTLELWDDDGAYASTTKQIEVQAPPVAEFSWNSWVDCGSSSQKDEAKNEPELEPVPCELVVEFDAGASYDPYHNNIQSFYWDFGDGSITQTKYEGITHRFDDATKSYEVTLTVEDGLGLEGSTTKNIYDKR